MVRRHRLATAATEPERIDKAIIYTDGGCDSKTGFGGWGVAVYAHGYRHDLHGGATQTTNNRMELQAAIEAIRFIDNPAASLIIRADSQYVIKGITEYIWGWKQKGWMSSPGKPVKNKDLWLKLEEVVEAQDREIEWQWVRGHSGEIGNEIADQLATAGRFLAEEKLNEYEEIVERLG